MYKSEALPARLAFEEEISESIRRSLLKKYVIEGYSETAGSFVAFDIDLDYSDGQTPNFRERIICPLTKLNNRQRFISHFTQKAAIQNKYASIFIHEQSTPVYKYISSQLTDINVLGSEFISLEFRPGQMLRGLRHEDPASLTFDNGSFDIMLSCDILSKIPDLEKTASEASRVIRDGGIFIFSIPFTNENSTIQRARMEKGQVTHLMDPKYYHNMHTGKHDAVVFYDIGWDFLDLLKKNGFKNVYQLAYYSAAFGYLGEGCQSIFIAEK